MVALSSVVRANGPYADAIRSAIGDAWIAPSYQQAADASRTTPMSVATLAGEVFHGPALVSGGTRAEARGILETKREIKELRDRIAVERGALTRLAQETTELEAAIAQASNAIAALDAERHKHEKAMVGYESQLQHARDEETRLAQRAAQLVRERRQSEEERDALDRRREEARASIARLENDQRLADERLTVADVGGLDDLSRVVRSADKRVATLRATSDGREATIREARGALDAIRAVVSELDIARATAEGDLSHLAYTCEDAVNATLDEVLREVEQLEAAGQAVPDAAALRAEEPGDDDEDAA